MDPSEIWRNYAGAAQSIATAIGLMVGGGWAWRRFVRQEEKYPHLQTSAELIPIVRQGDAWIIEVAAVLENKGRVTHRFATIEFDLNGLFGDDTVRSDPRWGGQADFPRAIASGPLLAPGGEYFIGPGVKARYSWLARVPIEATAISAHCRFAYLDRPKAFHSMEATIALNAAGPPANP